MLSSLVLVSDDFAAYLAAAAAVNFRFMKRIKSPLGPTLSAC